MLCLRKRLNQNLPYSQVKVCDENGKQISETKQFGRPASISSNGRLYVIGYHYGGEGVSCVKMYTPVDT